MEDPDILKEFLGALKDPSMKSTTRLLILISLSINRKMSFKEIQIVSQCGKGSLSNHLDKLKEDGLVTIKTVIRSRGPGIYVSITDRGIEVYQRYLELMKELLKNSEVKGK